MFILEMNSIMSNWLAQANNQCQISLGAQMRKPQLFFKQNNL
jgi:hypothetical protein